MFHRLRTSKPPLNYVLHCINCVNSDHIPWEVHYCTLNLKIFALNPKVKLVHSSAMFVESGVNLTLLNPAEYKKKKPFIIDYGFTQSQFGSCIIGIANGEELCFLAFYETGRQESAIENLNGDWPDATLRENNNLVVEFGKIIFEHASKPLKVVLRGTEFQLNVWQELMKLGAGSTASYESIAEGIGKPLATRAVASAIAKNRVSYVIPCHRVIHKSGTLGNYRWGMEKKKEILKYEGVII